MSDSISRAYRDGSITDGVGKPSAASDCYALGDRVRLLKDIWENEQDGLIPAHYLARKGEILVVCWFGGLGKASMGIAHENRTDDAYFIVFMDEVEKA